MRVTTKLAKTWVALAVISMSCGGAPKKDEAKLKEKASTTAMELGMKDAALQDFQAAASELSKAKPDNGKAIENLKRVVEAEPDFAEAHYNLGLLLVKLGDSALAETHLSKAHDLDPEILDYTVALGRAYAGNKKFDEAKILFSEVVAREPNNLTAKNNLAVLAVNRGDIKDAMDTLEDILRQDDSNVAALNTLGLVYHKKGNLSLAKYMFNKALKVDKKNADLHNNLGMVHMQEDHLPMAVKSFSKAIEVDPNYLESRLNLGAILLEYLDYGRADEQFTEAVRIAPSNCAGRLGRAATSYALGRHQESADGYLFYVDACNTKHVSSYERLAKLSESFLGKPKDAIGHYETLLTLVDSSEQKTQYNAMINFLNSQLNPKAQKTPEEEPEADAPGDDAGAEDQPSEPAAAGDGESG